MEKMAGMGQSGGMVRILGNRRCDYHCIADGALGGSFPMGCEGKGI